MGPRFSIITPVHQPPPDILQAMLRSVTTQSFRDWELCIVDDGSRSPEVRRLIDAAAADDPRIRAAHRADNGGIVVASNDALDMARGEFVVLLDHDDELHPDALALVDEALTAQPEADYAYSDEDKISRDGRRSAPFFKPSWSPERLRTQMYTCHVSVLRRALVAEVGGFRAEFEGAQDWDLVLRVTERARAVVHVPHVLYHWRMLDSSTASGGEAAKPYAYEAGTRALQEHCDRVGFPAVVERDLTYSGVYHLQPALERHPPVSIVIPTAGTRRDVRGEVVTLVRHCVRSILDVSTYPDYEIVLVADISTPSTVLRELEAIGGGRVVTVPYGRPFSFSDKINDGALASSGEHLLLLNDDIEVITPDWIERLVMYSGFPGIGAVGAKLLYEDGRIQHAGVMTRHASPGHLFRGFGGDYGGYANVVRVANNYSAVTGACVMTPRKLFMEVGGLSPAYPVNFNDVDYCLKIQSTGQRVVYDPDTVLYHFESSSRSSDVSDMELELFQRRWWHATFQDPYDNPNFHPATLHMVPPIYRPDGTMLP
jgi:glycosyltransferase involved in cell wall biosynthesis